METKSKEQAGAELLAAIDGYIGAVMAEYEKEKISGNRKRMQKCIEEHKNNPIRIPDDARGPYAQFLREELGT